MKRKQIIVLGLVLVIIAVGILQYGSGSKGEYPSTAAGDNTDTVSGAQSEELPGAAVYVNNDDKAQADQNVASGTDTAADIAANTAADTGSGFFAQARLDRDKSRSKQKEELKSLADNGDPANPATLTAQDELVAVINRCDTENTMESLIKQSGFDDAIVYMSDTGNVDVIVMASSLSATQVAKISDIVVRHSGASMENISVKNEN